MDKTAYDERILKGQRVPLFAIEVLHVYAGEGEISKNNKGRWFIHNQSWEEVRVFRETVFTHGIFWQKAQGRGEIIFPVDLISIKIDLQPKGWKENV